jgi:adenosylcobyric acid synthase
VNRFRGDLKLFNGGRRMMEERTARPCLGVFPFLEGVHLDAEDSVALGDLPSREHCSPNLEIVIVRLPHISNFTDFRSLPAASYVTTPAKGIPDCIILPGSKNTIADLRWLRAQGLDRWILDCHEQGVCVWGICGGFQMLGKAVVDPQGVEGAATSTEGLGLLPVETTLLAEKTTRAVEAHSAKTGLPFQAYEIHMGETRPAAGDSPFALVEGVAEGFRAPGIIGTYLHGGFEDPRLLEELLTEVACYRGKTITESPTANSFSRLTKDENYDLLADWFEQHADLARFEALYL